MKPKTFVTFLSAAALFLSAAAFAADYSNYSLKELSQMRCNMMNMSQEDRDAFRTAWRQKMQDASAQERQKHAWSRETAKECTETATAMGAKALADADTDTITAAGNGAPKKDPVPWDQGGWGHGACLTVAIKKSEFMPSWPWPFFCQDFPELQGQNP